MNDEERQQEEKTNPYREGSELHSLKEWELTLKKVSYQGEHIQAALDQPREYTQQDVESVRYRLSKMDAGNQRVNALIEEAEVVIRWQAQRLAELEAELSFERNAGAHWQDKFLAAEQRITQLEAALRDSLTWITRESEDDRRIRALLNAPTSTGAAPVQAAPRVEELRQPEWEQWLRRKAADPSERHTDQSFAAAVLSEVEALGARCEEWMERANAVLEEKAEALSEVATLRQRVAELKRALDAIEGWTISTAPPRVIIANVKRVIAIRAALSDSPQPADDFASTQSRDISGNPMPHSAVLGDSEPREKTP